MEGHRRELATVFPDKRKCLDKGSVCWACLRAVPGKAGGDALGLPLVLIASVTATSNLLKIPGLPQEKPNE